MSTVAPPSAASRGGQIPFRIAIVTVVVGLLVVTCAFLIAHGLHTGRESIDVLKREYLGQVVDTTVSEVSRLTETAEQILGAERYRIVSGYYSTSDPLRVAQGLAGALETGPDIQWVSYSEAATGRFMGARRLRGSEFILNVSDPRRERGVPREFRADTLAPYVSATAPTEPYEPRVLPWYQRAVAQPGTIVWMPPYVFTEGVKGITAAVAVQDASRRVWGVLTVDFTLAGMANFLRGVKVGAGGAVVLLDKDGQALAGGSGPGLEAATWAVRASPRPPGGTLHSEVVVGGDTWDVVTRSLAPGSGFAWTAVVAVPDEEFMGPVHANRRAAIAIALGGVILAILAGVQLSTRMARPLHDATDALDRVARFELETPSVRRSLLREIALLQDAVGRVTASLRSFTRYAPEEIVREVVVSGREAMLSGEKREVSVLFCDLRGFTKFAEQVRAEEVVALLNDHFDLLVTLISKHGGFVVDFLGDSVFAVFGAPEADPRHAERALACAIEMQRARSARNQEHRTRQWPPLEMGVGISTGAAVVGNMGSRHRIKYGVVGSIVNLAARIETFTVGGQVFVADSTRRALGERLVVDGPLEAEGKGVAALMRFWEVLALRGETLLTLPSPVRDLAELAVPLEARLRLFLGKHLDRQSHPARVLRLGAGGAELESTAPLEVFGSLHVLLPLGDAGDAPEALDGKVIAFSERDGRRTALVRFTGMGWDQQERVESFGRGSRGAAPT
jgi:adenylate cyclase